ncbi:MAG: hypothetical protein IPP91_11150 [Betaproteobacteria bacterium]|nr:hypothetical protein [Betaproteobacteria bacterium]
MSLKKIEMDHVRGKMDDSTSRESNRQLRRIAELHSISLTLGVMAANRCPTRTEPLDSTVYESEAGDCLNAVLPQSIAERCDFSRWTGGR